MFIGHEQGPKIENYGLEYNKYLVEVVNILENDPEFSRKMQEANDEDIKDGTIARELEFLSHGVRCQLSNIFWA